jgi:ribosomal protein S7
MMHPVGHDPEKGPIDGHLVELLDMVRKPLALYALWLGADEFGVSISSQGIQVIESATHKTAPQYRVQNLKENWIRRANTALDLVLKFLDENKEDYTGFEPQDADLFIRTTLEFNSEVDIRESRRVFVSLKPIIRSVEKKYIRPTLSAELFEELKEAWQSNEELASEQLALLDLIRPALAHLTMARALLEISIDVLDWGIFDTAGNTFANVSSKQASNKDRISIMAEASQRDGEAELKALQQFLDESASEDLYPAYFHSTRYGGKANALQRTEFFNKPDNSFFLA